MRTACFPSPAPPSCHEEPVSGRDLPHIQLVYSDSEGHRGHSHIWLRAGRYLSSFVRTELRLSQHRRLFYLWEKTAKPREGGMCKFREEGVDSRRSRGDVSGMWQTSRANIKITGCRAVMEAGCGAPSRVSGPPQHPSAETHGKTKLHIPMSTSDKLWMESGKLTAAGSPASPHP